jgi:hypothetical protein
LDGDDPACVIERAGLRRFDEHVAARQHALYRDVGVHLGRQADVDQVHVVVGDDAVEVGSGGEPELVTDRRQLLRCPPKDDYLCD